MIAFICGMHIVSGGFFEEDTIESQKSKEKISFYKIKPDNPEIVVGALIVCVALMTIIFSTLDNAVTLVHASGDHNIGQAITLIILFTISERYLQKTGYTITPIKPTPNTIFCAFTTPALFVNNAIISSKKNSVPKKQKLYIANRKIITMSFLLITFFSTHFILSRIPLLRYALS